MNKETISVSSTCSSDNLIRESEDVINMTEVVVTEIGELWEEQYDAVIYTAFETKLIDDAPDYQSLKETPAYEALMDALETCEIQLDEGTCGLEDTWFGESKRDPLITAVLRIYDDPDDEPYFEPLGEEFDLPEYHFTAEVYRDREIETKEASSTEIP